MVGFYTHWLLELLMMKCITRNAFPNNTEILLGNVKETWRACCCLIVRYECWMKGVHYISCYNCLICEPEIRTIYQIQNLYLLNNVKFNLSFSITNVGNVWSGFLFGYDVNNWAGLRLKASSISFVLQWSERSVANNWLLTPNAFINETLLQSR